MPVFAAVLALFLSAAPAEKPAIVVSAPDAPILLERAVVLTPSQGPPVLLYSAKNSTNDAFEQFTVIAFVFDAQGTLKARHTAPGRRTLDPHETKYSTLVMDGSEMAADYQIVVGVNGAQRAGSDAWWQADLNSAAAAAARTKKEP